MISTRGNGSLDGHQRAVFEVGNACRDMWNSIILFQKVVSEPGSNTDNQFVSNQSSCDKKIL